MEFYGINFLSPKGWIYDISHSYPLAFFVLGGLCALASCILHLVPVFQETTFSEDSSNEKKTTLENTTHNKYPKLCYQDLCHQKIISSKLHSPQVDTPEDWRQVLAGARETDV